MTTDGAEINNHRDVKYVDSKDGHVQNLVHSGMVPVYSNQKGFGHLPSYLVRYKKSKEDEMVKWEREKRAEEERKENMKLSDQERNSILEVQCNTVI